jgi:hypothetical protein
MPSTPPHITISKSGCTEDPSALLLLLLLEGLVLAAAVAAEAAATAAVAESRCWSPAGRGATPKLGLRRLLLLLLLWLLLLLGLLRAGSSEAKGWLLVVMTVGPCLCGSCFCCFMAC